ncbi:hypothetical protein LCGC14_0903650 [marine sediment metagenome]|uniref:Uncharacterized protein n=1 Tax=marine sediment metagenome TaxID=412755 RepID=A0A0F9NVL0_9ZZZZ
MNEITNAYSMIERDGMSILDIINLEIDYFAFMVLHTTIADVCGEKAIVYVGDKCLHLDYSGGGVCVVNVN